MVGMKRLWIPALALIVCVSGFAVAADALVTSDAERIEAFLDGASASNTTQRLDTILEYANPADREVRVESSGEVQLFGAGQGQELAEWLQGELDVFRSSEQKLLQHSTQIVEPGEARVTTRVRDSDREQTLIFHLIKQDGQWRIQRLRVL